MFHIEVKNIRMQKKEQSKNSFGIFPQSWEINSIYKGIERLKIKKLRNILSANT